MRRYLTKAVKMRLDGKTYQEIGEATGRCGQRIRQVFDQFNRYYTRWQSRYTDMTDEKCMHGRSKWFCTECRYTKPILPDGGNGGDE